MEKTKQTVQALINDMIDEATQGDCITAYNMPCVVTVYHNGVIVATGMGTHQLYSADFGRPAPSPKLISMTVGEVFHPALTRYVNQEVTTEMLQDAVNGD